MQRRDAASTLPSPGRRLALNLCVAGFLLGSALSLITQRELWPFSPYPMFAALQGPELTVLDIVGISANDSQEIALAPRRSRSIVAGTRYREAMDRLVANGSESEIRAYLANAASRYEHARPVEDPPLRAVRLYRSRWQAVEQERPPARRVDRQLLTEVELSR